MPSFSDVANALSLPACCMRKSPTPKDNLDDDIRMLWISFSLYVACYFLGFHSICLISMATLNILTFQTGMRYHEIYSKNIHLNQFDELDTSNEQEEEQEEDEEQEQEDGLSLKQREHGASIPRPMTDEQEEKLNEQLRKVVEETNLRNRKRSDLSTARTPSSTTLADDEYKLMPPLVSEVDPIIKKTPASRMTWSDVPNFSQTHYLHAFEMDELD
jgi:hypothetical protein